MALGDPIYISLPNATMTLAAETGAIVESFERAVDSKIKEVYSMTAAAVIGYVFYDPKAMYNWSAIVNGTTGLAIAAPGVALTFANDFGIGASKNGVSAGGTYTQTFRVTHAGEDLRKMSGTAVQRQGVA